MTSFDVVSANLAGEPLAILRKNQWRKNHSFENGVLNLGEDGLNLSIKLPENLQGEHDVTLRVKINGA